MKTATGLGLLAVGAILTFAVRASPPGLNIHSAGWIIMLTGVAWFLLASRGSSWMRRIAVRREPAGPVVAEAAIPVTEDDSGLSYPQYVLHDPAALASAILRDAELSGSGQAGAGQGQGQAPADQARTRPLLHAVRDSHEPDPRASDLAAHRTPVSRAD
ncbi:MAG: hypothetical protein ABJB47_08370 [Actinomycetota bacterium]